MVIILLPVTTKKTPPAVSQNQSCMPYFCFIIRLLTLLKIFPFDWNSRTRNLEPSRNAKRSIVWFHFCVTLFFIKTTVIAIAFLTCLMGRLVKPDKRNLNQLLESWAALTVHGIFLLAFFNLVKFRNEVKLLTNEILNLRLRNRVLYSEVKFIKAGVIIYVARSIQFILLGLTKSKGPQSVFSLLPSSLQNKFTLLLYVGFSIYTSFGCWVAVFLVSLLIAYLDTVRYFLKQRIPSASCHEKLLSYKKLMVLQNLVEFVLRQAFMVQATTYCFMTGIFASFGCLCLYGEIDNKVYASMLISYFAVTTFSYTFFTRTGKLVGLSSSYVRASFAGPSIMKNVGPRASSGVDDVETYSEQVGIRSQAEIRAYMKACRPLSVRVGNMGTVKKNQFLKMLSFIVIQTMRLLIMTKNSELT